MRCLVLVAVLSAVATSACLEVDGVPCGDGICPHGSMCYEPRHTCVSPAAVTACEGIADGGACSVENVPGTCIDGACELSFCGDGIRAMNEQCEGSDLGVDDAGNPNDCTTAGFYEAGGLQCSRFCTFDVSACTGYCGDGVVNGSEPCEPDVPVAGACSDYGFDVGVLGCSNACAVDFGRCEYLGWAHMTTPSTATLEDLWVTSQNDVYAVSNVIGLTLHFDGAHWTPTMEAASMARGGITATGPSNVFVGIVPGTYDRWNGTTWTRGTLAAGFVASSMFALDANNIYAAGYPATPYRFDGNSWQAMPATGGTNGLVAITALGTSDVWAVGGTSGGVGYVYRYTGSSWSNIAPTAGSITGISAESASSVYVTDANYVYHWTGSGWATPEPVGGFNASSIWVHGGVGFVTEAGGTIEALAADGTKWVQSSPVQSAQDLRSIHADAAGHLYAVGRNGAALRYTGASWLDVLQSGSGYGTSIWGTGPTSLFGGLGNSSGLVGFNGATWQTLCAGILTVRGVWGSSATAVWGVGAAGSILTYNGSSCSTVASGVAQVLNAIWGSGAADIYAVGYAGSVVHYNGSAWSLVTTPVPASDALLALWGADATHLFAVGTAGRLLRLTGTTWTTEVIGPGVDLNAVWGASATDVWAVGAEGTILHFDGQTWTQQQTATTNALTSVGGTGTRDVFAGGAAGTLLHYDGATWSSVTPPKSATTDVTAIWTNGRHVFFGNTNYTLDRTAFPAAGCASVESGCADGHDDDCDFLVDCRDPDCAATCGL